MEKPYDAERMRSKLTEKYMKAALKLATTFTDLREGEHSFSEPGWLDFYTYEPLESGLADIRKVIQALLCVADPTTLTWEFRVFASNGSFTTMADGTKPEFLEASANPIAIIY